MRIIYIDSLFILNLAVNYLLMLATAKICALRPRYLRFLPASAFGAAYAVVTVLPGVPGFVTLVPIRLAAGVIMALITFGSERQFGKHIVVYFALAACFAGSSMIVGIVSFEAILLTVSCAYALLTIALKFAAARREPAMSQSVKLGVTLNGKHAEFRVLRDTGNSLRDPVNGEILPIVNFAEVTALFRPEVRTILASGIPASEQFTQLAESGSKLTARLIPYRAVGLDRGLLLAFRTDSVTVDGKPRNSRWVALSPTPINAFGGVI
jgi:stage II sporulation protein GA (sporulation sigma-E factor processing peptidase)